MSTIDNLFKVFVPVFARRHAPYTKNGEVHDFERFIYSPIPSPCNAVSPNEDTQIDRHYYAGGELAMFAFSSVVPGEPMKPMYLLRKWSEPDKREYFMLSFELDEGDYHVREIPGQPPGTPRFYVFTGVGSHADCLAQVYRHFAPNADGSLRYKYDFNPKLDGEWGEGLPVFFAVKPEVGKAALRNGAGAGAAAQYAKDWFARLRTPIAALAKTISPDMTRDQLKALENIVTSTASPAAATAAQRIALVSLGAGAHFDLGPCAIGFDVGAIWFEQDFGLNGPIANYSNEQVTIDVGLDIGAGADVVCGMWFGSVDQIEGACNGVGFTVQAGAVGLTVTFLWTGTWEGANHTGHPIGIALTLSAGLEGGISAFYSASVTQFWNKRPNFTGGKNVNALTPADAPESTFGGGAAHRPAA